MLCGLASLGDVRTSELLEFVSRLQQEEFPILLSALALDKTNSLQLLREQIPLYEGVTPIDAMLRITAMELGAPQYLWQMAQFGNNPKSHFQQPKLSTSQCLWHFEMSFPSWTYSGK